MSMAPLAGISNRLHKITLCFLLLVVTAVTVNYLNEAYMGELRLLPFHVTPAQDANSYPAVWRILSDADVRGVNPGDHLLSINGINLRGATNGVEIITRGAPLPTPSELLAIEIERAGKRVKVDIQPYYWGWWLWLPFVAASIFVAAFLLLKAFRNPLSKMVAYTCILLSIIFMSHLEAPTLVADPRSSFSVWAQLILRLTLMPIAAGITIYFPFYFPSRLPVSRYCSIGVACVTTSLFFVARGGRWLAGGSWFQFSDAMFYMVHNIWAVACIAILTWNYRNANAAGRRQARWFIWGIYLGSLPSFVFYLIESVIVVGGLISPALGAVNHSVSFFSLGTVGSFYYALAEFGVAAIPLSMLIAMQFHRFLDVDPIISATAFYTLLVIFIGAALPNVIPWASSSAAQLLGGNSNYIQAVLIILIVVGGFFLERRLRPWVGKVLFRDSREFDEKILRLQDQLDSGSHPEELFKILGDQFSKILDLEQCVIYLKKGENYEPIYVHATRLPPGLLSNASLIEVIANYTNPIRLNKWNGWKHQDSLDPHEVDFFESLHATTIFPIWRSEKLHAFIIVGCKRSGDILSDAELKRIALLVRRIPLVLDRLEQDDIMRNERAVLEEMLDYAPSAMKSRILEEGDFVAGECDVTVQFIDIRSSSALIEHRSPTDAFDLINRFSELVAQVAARYGGVVVEFQGDSLMVVYGAPAKIADKEKAAVRASIEMVELIESEEFSSLAGEKLQIGIGVASGTDYVGDFECVDRKIWSVVGNASNLAARLESLAKELGVSIVIDTKTHQRCGMLVDQFWVHRGVYIHGFSDSFTVWSLPRTNALGLKTE